MRSLPFREVRRPIGVARVRSGQPGWEPCEIRATARGPRPDRHCPAPSNGRRRHNPQYPASGQHHASDMGLAVSRPNDEADVQAATRSLQLPLDAQTARSLRAGRIVTLTGPVYAARDAAHRRMAAALAAGEALPVDLRGETIYYVGPTPARPGRVIG